MAAALLSEIGGWMPAVGGGGSEGVAADVGVLAGAHSLMMQRYFEPLFFCSSLIASNTLSANSFFYQ